MLRNIIFALFIVAVGTIVISKVSFAPAAQASVKVAEELPVEYIELEPLYITASPTLAKEAACGDDANCDFVVMEAMVITADPVGATTVACADGSMEC